MTMNENKMNVGAFFQKYTMVIALVIVVIFFAIAGPMPFMTPLPR